ncbi:serine-repeat antigen 3b [Plasmodium gonderi]|uniref:Serine-repeat antigen 3b n=1 Tax=Plasmodium gonderi TaxID=77519 RepID=A0A1Y1JAI2_PLAGO|nr:serine-repeat antigen 3b [Plasmodium gonderi]GAW79531.1 serine-repeat antigen 3b [Plasmodium gonderi]
MKSFSCVLLILGLVFTSQAVRCTSSSGTEASSSSSGPQSVSQSGTGGDTPGKPSTDSSSDQNKVTEVSAQASPNQPGSQATIQTTPSPVVQPVTTPDSSVSGSNVIAGAPAAPSPEPTAEVPSDATSTTIETTQPSVTNPFAVKSALLKDHNGLKITGPCKSNFQVYLVPYLYINVNALESEIEMEPTFMKVDEKIKFEKDKKNIHNKCGENKTFKLVIFIYDGVLTIKWKVYPPKSEGDTDKTLDIRKYKMRDSGMPITSMQVQVVTKQNETLYVESKNYSVKNDIPEKCDALANDCFLSGILDVQKCYHCTLLMQEKQKAEECFKYISPEIRNRFDEIKTTGQDEDEADKVELEETIDNILKNIYKNEDGENKLKNNFDLADNSLKQELIKYCKLLKQTDTSGVLDNHQMANEEEAFTNLTNMIEISSNYNINDLKGKLKNVAICMHNPDEWVASKIGLDFPILLEKNSDNLTNIIENKSIQKDDMQEGENGIMDLTTPETVDVSPLHITDKILCNDEYCDRTKDTSSCLPKIEAEDQGICATSWIFASKLHLETIKCMKGYDHVSGSALFVANCSQKEGAAKCHAASHPLEFLNTVVGNQFLPSSSDMPYSYKLVGNVCPKPKNHWTNLWNNIKLLNHENVPNSVGTKGYTAYQSEQFKNNMVEFMKIVKGEIMTKGSAIAYVKAKDVLYYNFNGKVVHSICGSEKPDLAVNIIGYGNYINSEGQKKSYWLVRNSWGKYWGDKGNFKVDMDTPDQCQHNFIHTAAVFNLDIPQIEITENKGPEIQQYYMKNSPDFYNNLYYKNFDALKANNSSNGNGSYNNSVIQGQSDVEGSSEKTSLTNSAIDLFSSIVSTAASAALSTAKVAAELVTGEQTREQVGTATEGTVAASGGASGGSGNSETSVTPSRGESPEGDTGSQTVLSTGTGQTAQETTDRNIASASDTTTSNSQSTQVSAPAAKAPLSSLKGTKGVNVERITGVLHFLKNVKNGKVKGSLVTYDNGNAIGDEKVCSRAHSSDVDKIDECIKFCENNWSACKGTVSPGYCLAKKKGNNDCFFCFV